MSSLLKRMEEAIEYAWKKVEKDCRKKRWIFYDENDIVISFCHHLRRKFEESKLNCGFATEFGFSDNIILVSGNKRRWDWFEDEKFRGELENKRKKYGKKSLSQKKLDLIIRASL